MKISKRNFLFRVFSSGGRQAFTIISSFIGAKFLGIQDFAVYTYILTIFSVLTMLGDFGLSTAITRFIAFDKTEENIKKVTYNGLLVFLISSLTLALIVYPLQYFRIINIELLHVHIIVLTAISSIGASLLDGILRGQKRFKESGIATVVAFVLAIIAEIPLLIKFGLVGGLFAQFIFWTLLLLITLFLGKIQFEKDFDKKTVMKIASYAVQFGIASVSYFMFSRYLIFVLESAKLWNTIAIYDLLSKVMIVFTFPFTIYGQTLAPYFSDKEFASNPSYILKETIKYTKLLTFAAVGSGIVFWVLCQLLFKYLLPQYALLNEFSFTLGIMVVLLGINIWTYLIDSGILVATGYAYIMSIVYPIIAIVSFILLPIALQFGGVNALLITLAILQLIMALTTRIFFTIKLKNNITD
jgi:O-antigen/teichoic acid export membrane protein